MLFQHSIWGDEVEKTGYTYREYFSSILCNGKVLKFITGLDAGDIHKHVVALQLFLLFSLVLMLEEIEGLSNTVDGGVIEEEALQQCQVSRS